MPGHHIATTRLSLTPVTNADIDRLHALLVTAPVRRYLMDDVIVRRELIAERVASSVGLFADMGVGLWTVARTSDREFIGLCGFHRQPPSKTELIYALEHRYWHFGYATEAAVAAMTYAFDVAGQDEVIARCDPPNTDSQQVMRRIGLKYREQINDDGIILDVFGLTREEFEASRTT
tara:strand:- start:298 stop:828 length:531 start_codon:yes stop_codon:yes gene_type:complete